MTGLVRKTALLCAGGLMLAGAAIAAVPDPAKSSIGCNINLGGTTGGVVDPRVEKVIIVRDAGNNVIPNSTVVINFNSCVSQDMRLCSTQPFVGMVVSCSPNKTVTTTTDAAGQAIFRIVGGATNNGGNPAGATTACATVVADNINLGSLKFGAFDENNSGGVNPSDLSSFLGDRFAPQPAGYRTRSDFDCTNTLTPADLSLFLGVRFGGGSSTSCTTSCAP